jgi:hypothetical protein
MHVSSRMVFARRAASAAFDALFQSHQYREAGRNTNPPLAGAVLQVCCTAKSEMLRLTILRDLGGDYHRRVCRFLMIWTLNSASIGRRKWRHDQAPQIP